MYHSQGHYKKLEDDLKNVVKKAKEPIVDASHLLKELVDEISCAKKNLENGLIRKFEESNTRSVCRIVFSCFPLFMGSVYHS